MRRLACALLAAASLAVGAAPAAAGTYDVVACDAAPGAVNASWSAWVPGSHMRALATCPSTGSPEGGIVVSNRPGAGPPAPLEQAWQSFWAPPGAHVVGITFSGGYWRPGASEPGAEDYAAELVDANAGSHLDGCSSYTTARCHVWQPGGRSVTIPPTSGIAFVASCWGLRCRDGVLGPAAAFGATSAAVRVTGATVRVSDSRAPAVTIAGGDLAGGWRGGERSVAYRASDNVGIRAVRAYVGDTQVAGETLACDHTRPVPCPAAPERSLAIDTRLIADGVHTLRVEVVDAAANPASAQTTVQVDNSAPPAPAIAAPSRWLTAADPPHLDIALAPGGAEPPSGIAGYSVTRDASEPDATVDAPGAAATHRLGDLPEGTTTVRARAVSGAGVAGDSAEAAVRVDRTAPVLRVDGAGSPSVPHPGPVVVTVSARDALSGMGAADEGDPVTGGAHVAYRLDSGGWTRVGGDEARVAIEGDGDHTLAYYAVDAAGNRSGEVARTVAIGVRRVAVDPAGGGFRDRSVNPTTFAAADRFGAPCPQHATLVADRDSLLLSRQPAARSGGLDALQVGPGTFEQRDSVVGFPLPPAADCTVESATLRLHAASFVTGDPSAGRRIEVTRASAAWDEATVSWSTRPGTVGVAASATTPAPPAPRWVEWDVTAQLQAIYRLGDNGLYLRDAGPTNRDGSELVGFCSREASAGHCADPALRPQLVLRFAP